MALYSAGLGASYGLFARFVFGLQIARDVFEVMSITYIFVVPVVLGFITILYGPQPKRYFWGACIVLPWLASLACLAGALIFAWEGIICIALLLPIILLLSSVGGLIGGICLRVVLRSRDRNLCVGLVAVLPFIMSPLEQLHSADSEIRTVQTEIKIHADAATVWNQIRSVPLITDKEQSFSFSHLLGFPRPLEAKLVGSGVGAVRYATFEHGVLFVETIQNWDPPRLLSFSIKADTKNIPPNTFDEHITVGGRYFDVLKGTYQIEDLGHGEVMLHLSSEQRLSTRFNFYSHLWTEYLMADLQNYILNIIKKHCEDSSAVATAQT